ncbi:NAD(P)H-dependent oxidoreductase [Paenibacillus hexagrammi]|uniref:FMN dependent NADH:quinone oxidoreductase n=1 Tax=Paenibacillus hexagrammi TaxID=2908839 RepID=A0ABY3SJZ4_9BACL|nr:NAD(P)H-dependent oxidoreductase [Paenibacillus sp. YPD9-1]UJF33531.1 NAD(P)H-dependent oxidoreductase [Paenibacillus sp. YPD9-1]
MSKVLYITANPANEETSFSLSVGRAFLNTYKSLNPSDEIVELDLYNMSIPLIDADILAGWGALRSGTAFEALSEVQQQKVAALDALTNQFVEADSYIFVTPMWNLGLPPLMKAYIDTVIVAGKTFKYTAEGPVGLMKGKKGVHINARGGIYSGDLASIEFGDSYLKTIMGFIGVEMVDSIVAEGMAYAPDKAQEIKEAAISLSENAAKALALK